jgi:hypothetical protein
MNDTHTLEDSASGKNAHMLACNAIGQRMSYAACLNRIKVVQSDQRAPADWSVCKSALGCRQCPAKDMRDDEIEAGHALFFVAREDVQNAVAASRDWVSSWDKPAPKRRAAKTALDAAGDLGTYSDAINAAPRTSKPIPVALAGETPVQMARRLAAEQAATTT